MKLDPEFWLHILQAVGLGLGVALLLWLLRRYAPVRRVQLSVLMAAAIGGLYLIVNDSGLPGEKILVQVIVAAGILLAANALLQLLDLLLWDYLMLARRHIAVPRLLVDLFNFAALAAVALVVLKAVFNVELSALLVTSTVVSAIIGLSLQDTLGNVLAGLALQLEHPFTVGDWVLVGGQEGEVIQMNWRTLTLRTRDNHNIFLPNSNAAKEDIINYSRPTPLQRMHAQVGVAYDHAPGQVKDVLAHAARAVEGVCAEPAPEVVVTKYGDFSIDYDLRFWITDYARAQQIHDAVMTRLWYELRRAGMTIPFPIRNVTVRTLPEDHEARVRAQRQREIFAALRRLPLFAPLNDVQLDDVARGAVLQDYTAGEVLVRQGEEGASLFVIRSGRVRVNVEAESGTVTTVGMLGPDEFFGEMSLLTGEPRTASVIAVTETQVVLVDKPDLAAVIRDDTAMLGPLSAALEARTRNAAEQVAAGTGPLAERRRSQQDALLNRIRTFFGLRTERV